MSQTIINNGDSGLHVRTALNNMFTELYLNNNFVSIEQYYDESHAGDYRTAFLALIADCQANNKVAYFPRGTYYMSGVFVIESDFHIFADNAVITSDITSGQFLTFQGSIGEYSSITQTIEKGDNYIKSALSGLVPNDLIKIRSDRPFTSLVGYGESVGRGEMAVVRNVNTTDDIIYTHSGLLDTYDITNWDDNRDVPATSTPSDVRVAKISSISVTITGKLTLKNITTTYTAEGNASCDGLRLTYCRDCNIDITIVNFTQRGMAVYHCFGGSINADVYGAARDSSETGDGSPGYGIEVVGTTMNIKISGTIQGCRHSVVHNGFEGVGWNNPISIVGYGSRSNAIIDSHTPWGSMIVDGAVLHGGLISVIEKSLDPAYDPDTGVKSNPYGVQCGARHNIMRNIELHNLGLGLLTRAECECDDIVIDNIYFNTVTTCISFRDGNTAVGSNIKKITINNLTAVRSGILIGYNHDIFTGDFITINNVYTEGYLFYAQQGDRASSSKVSFLFNNVTMQYNASGEAWGSLYNKAMLLTDVDFINSITVNNAHIDGYDAFVHLDDGDDISDIKLNNIDFDGDDFIIANDAVVGDRMNLISLIACFIAITNSNIIDFTEAAQTVKNLIYDNIYANGATAITNGTATNNIAGNTIFD